MGNGVTSDNILLANSGTSNSFTVSVYIGSTLNHTQKVDGLSLNTWYHFLIIIASDGTITIYKDGTETGYNDVSISSNGFNNL